MKKLYVEELIYTENVEDLNLGITEEVDLVVGAKTYRTFTIPNNGNIVVVKVVSLKVYDENFVDTFKISINGSDFKDIKGCEVIELDI